MPYFCYCKDVPNSENLRQENTRAHLAYIESILDKILVAGPLGDPDNDGYKASCLIYDVDTPEEALELLHNDPYYIAGIFAEVNCQAYLPAAGTWIGGKIW